MNRRDGKVVVSSRPVNRRTAVQPVAPKAIAGSVKARLKAQLARHQCGPPLAAQLLKGASRPQPVRKTVLAGAMMSTAAAVGLFLSWLQASVVMAAVSAAMLVAGLVLIYAQRERGLPSAAKDTALPPLLDMQCVAAFDRALEAFEGSLPGELQQSLVGLKSVFLRLVTDRHIGSIP